jgi:Cdc6-like AAA superfamily ATPase
VLVKGPPGTGKTITLKGVLNVLHLREFQKFYEFILKVRPLHHHLATAAVVQGWRYKRD